MDKENKKATDRIRSMHSKGQMLHSASYYKSKDRHDASKAKALKKVKGEKMIRGDHPDFNKYHQKNPFK